MCEPASIPSPAPTAGRLMSLDVLLNGPTIGKPLASPTNGSLLWALMWVPLLYAVAWLMYRNKWLVKF